MTPRTYGPPTKAILLLISLLTIAIAGCEGDDGANGLDGSDGSDGAAGAPGSDGQACWDLNNNGVGDPEEDINGDGVVDVYDCNAYASGAYEIDQLHAGYFTENAYEGTKSCLVCHGKLADEFLTTAHFKWEGDAANIVNVAPGTIHGKNDIINNFCVAVPSNEGRCTQCHAGYGYKDDTFDFGDPENIDCLVCHDQTDTYAKDLKTAGLPVPGIDLNAVARSVATHAPTIENCIDCHGANGGGDGPRAYFIFPKPRNFNDPATQEYLTRQNLYNGIKHGVVGKEMPAWGKVLSDHQIADLTEYVYRQFIAAGRANQAD